MDLCLSALICPLVCSTSTTSTLDLCLPALIYPRVCSTCITSTLDLCLDALICHLVYLMTMYYFYVPRPPSSAAGY